MLMKLMMGMMMISILEFLFRRTMRVYWFSARLTGRAAGINEVKALIYKEIELLSDSKGGVMGHDAGQRVVALQTLLGQCSAVYDPKLEKRDRA
jgi:hypothetical protein